MSHPYDIGVFLHGVKILLFMGSVMNWAHGMRGTTLWILSSKTKTTSKTKIYECYNFLSVSKKKWRQWFSCQSMFVLWNSLECWPQLSSKYCLLLELKFFPLNLMLNSLNSFFFFIWSYVVENTIHVKSKRVRLWPRIC